ncbi:MAG: thioredoxin domain-containing protein [Gemmatimonadota bacterium]
MMLGITLVRFVSTGRALLVMAALATFVACGAEPEADNGAADVTRGLLSAAGANAPPPIPGPDGNPTPVRDVPVDDLGFNRGSSDAPVRVIEMSDYGCGYCRQFHIETFPSLREEFIETGMVEWKFVPYVTGMFDNSLPALRAAECTLEQSSETFEVVNERLWHDQAEWKRSGDAPGLVRSWVAAAGADMEAFDDCMASGRRFERIAAAGGLARQLGVRGTPTFLVVGYGPLQGALPLDTFRRVLGSVHQDVTGQ